MLSLGRCFIEVIRFGVWRDYHRFTALAAVAVFNIAVTKFVIFQDNIFKTEVFPG